MSVLLLLYTKKHYGRRHVVAAMAGFRCRLDTRRPESHSSKKVIYDILHVEGDYMHHEVAERIRLKNCVEKVGDFNVRRSRLYILTEQGKEVARDCLSRSGLADSTEGIATIDNSSDPLIEPISTHAQLVSEDFQLEYLQQWLPESYRKLFQTDTVGRIRLLVGRLS
ncbi:hypothetical protein Tco_0282433 [Tanacetum coccineum]